MNEIKIPMGCGEMLKDENGRDFIPCGCVASSCNLLDNPDQQSVYLCDDCSHNTGGTSDDSS